MVTHPCGPEKIERIRRMDVGAVEIDLSGYRNVPLDEVATAILSDAPRKWLHNPKSSAARGKLAELERKRVAGIEREARSLLNDAARLAADPPKAGEWEEAAATHGLARAIAAVRFATGFLVREEEWKAFALLQFGLAKKEGFKRKDVFAAIKANGWVARRFEFVGDEVAFAMRRAAGPDVKTPWEAVGHFMDEMKQAGVLMSLDLRGKMAGGKRLYAAIKEAAELRERPKQREERLRDLVGQILSPVRSAFKESFDFHAWLDQPDGDRGTPSRAISSDDGSFDELAGKLERLRNEMWMRPPQVTEDMGLPVIREAEARTAAHRAAEERRDKEAAEKAECEAGAREASLRESATAAMGTAAADWMSSPQDSLGGRSPAALARQSQSDYWRASDALERWRSTVREEGERQAMRDESLAALRAAAKADFRREDYAELWMRQPQHALGGKRPEEFCVDAATLATCVELLPGKVRKLKREPSRRRST
jgi:hypothetical protein